MTASTAKLFLPLTHALIRTMTINPTKDHTVPWDKVKLELRIYVKSLRLREADHQKDKVDTLVRWQAKAVASGKRQKALSSDAGVYEQMLAVGIPDWMVELFQKDDAALAGQEKALRGMVKELRKLGIGSRDGMWVLPWEVEEVVGKD